MMYIIYITTNLINHKIYFGVHEQEEPYKFDGYLGSGKNILKSIKKYGRENFKRETLLYYWSRHEAYAKESEIVTEEFIKYNWNYNTAPGGGGGVTGENHYNFGQHPSKETRKRQSLKKLGKPLKPEHIAKIRAANPNPYPVGRMGKGKSLSLEHRIKIGVAHKGKTLSSEHISKIIKNLDGGRTATKGTIFINNGIINRRIKIGMKIPSDFIKGRLSCHK